VTQHYSSSDSAKRTVTDTRSVCRPAASFIVGNSVATFLRVLNSTPNREFEKVMDGYAVTQDLSKLDWLNLTESDIYLSFIRGYGRHVRYIIGAQTRSYRVS
jgi:hypothetical protein